MIDIIYNYKGLIKPRFKLRIRIINTNDRDIVIATSLNDDDAPLDPHVPDLAGRIAAEFELDPHRISWINHTLAKTHGEETESERFHRIPLTWNNKKFSAGDPLAMDRDQVEAMIFMQLPDITANGIV